MEAAIIQRKDLCAISIALPSSYACPVSAPRSTPGACCSWVHRSFVATGDSDRAHERRCPCHKEIVAIETESYLNGSLESKSSFSLSSGNRPTGQPIFPPPASRLLPPLFRQPVNRQPVNRSSRLLLISHQTQLPCSSSVHPVLPSACSCLPDSRRDQASC